MKSLRFVIAFLSLFLMAPASVKLDVLAFMRPSYNIGGLTPLNSYLSATIKVWNQYYDVWMIHTEQTTCPESLGQQCMSVDWRMRTQTRQKPGESILYANKTYFPGKSDEVFWYNSNSIYNFQEPYAAERADYENPEVFGLFHNYFLPPGDNPAIGFPNRGYFWSARYYPAAPVTLHNVRIRDFRNNKFSAEHSGSSKVIHTLEYIPAYTDTGNIPGSLQVIVNTQENYNADGSLFFTEKYFYARSFGLIRFERWEWYAGEYILVNLNLFNTITPYPSDENPDTFFEFSSYADPKLESWPGEPGNGALSRGRFQQSNGAWMQLTSILTDGDWLLAPVCPNGYSFAGSLFGNYVDHQGKASNGWVVLCGTNKHVLLAQSCPDGYVSRGQIVTRYAFDYQRRSAYGKPLVYCVLEREILP